MKHIQTDIAVVGGGATGLAAAVTAAQAGAKVALFEKAPKTGGAANMAAGLFAVESRLQKERNINVTRDEIFKLHMEYTHWRVDAQLVRAYIDKSAGTIEWLQELGVQFRDIDSHVAGANLVWHLIGGEPPRPSPMVKILTAKARELGVKIYTKTPGREITKKKGKITGVIAEEKTGESIQTEARAVIIGTGGYSDNPEWVKKYTGFTYEGRDVFSLWMPGSLGEGIKMAWDAGATASEMNIQLGANWPSPVGGPIGGIEFDYLRKPNLMVNLKGERFANEELTDNNPFLGHAVNIQKDHCAFMIIDENTNKYYEQMDKENPPPMFLLGKGVTGDLATKIKKIQAKGYNYFFVADTIEDLATQTGIELPALQKTIEDYNVACQKGRDDLFNKHPEFLRPIMQPRFYAAKYVIRAGGCLGGIKINHRAEVLNKKLNAIPGLYAGGADANAIYGDSYPMILAGNNLGFAVNTGRMAAENAVKFIKSRSSA